MKQSVKERIINLLQKTNNDSLLEQVYSILDSAVNSEQGEIWNNLSVKDKEDTLLSIQESRGQDNLIDHEDAMKEIRIKLGWI